MEGEDKLLHEKAQCRLLFLNTILLNLLEVKGRKDFDNPALGEVCCERV